MADTRRVVGVVIVALFLLGSTFAFGQATHRPIEDFTLAQINITGWIASDSPYVGIIDHAGTVNRALANNHCPIELPTTITGDVLEQPLPDGTARVQVVLRAKNAFARAYLAEDGTPVLGGTRSEVCRLVVPPALGDLQFKLDFISLDGMNAPMPDFITLLNGAAPRHVYQGMLVNAIAQGSLRYYVDRPAGTPGTMRIVQLNPHVPGAGIAGKDSWPAEIVNVKPTGN